MSESKHELTQQETDLYDRQIRLWGLESQKKLRAADVLLIGVRALGAEVAKNILLSGIKSLTFLDDGKVTKDDLICNFLLPRDSLGKNVAEAVIERAQNLNPMVEISADVSSIEEKTDEFYKKFTIVIGTRLSEKQLITINESCRMGGVQFICGDVFGMFGFVFSDLLKHEFYEDVKKLVPNKKRKLNIKSETVTETVRVVKTLDFVQLQNALEVDWKSCDQKKINKMSPWYFLVKVLLNFRDEQERNVSADEKDSDLEKLRDIRDEFFKAIDIENDKISDADLEMVFGENVPVCAVVGGVLAQELIKAVSHNESPIHNMCFFDPYTLSGKIEYIAN